MGVDAGYIDISICRKGCCVSYAAGDLASIGCYVAGYQRAGTRPTTPKEIIMTSAKSPNAVDVTVGRNVKRIRNMVGMSQETLASKLGITFQQVQKYEKGTNRISASKLVAVSLALDCSIAQLFADVDASSNNIFLPNLSTAALRLAGEFDKIASVSQRGAIVRLVESLARHDASRPAVPEE